MSAPFELDAFRRLLRTKRELLPRGAKGRVAFAEKIGVSKSTVQRAEEGPDVPQIDTCAKFIEGTGYKLSEFFAELEKSSATPLREPQGEHKDPTQHVPPTEAIPHGAAVPALIERALNDHVLFAGFERIATALERISERLGTGEQRSASADTNPPVRRQRAGRSRRPAD